MLVLFKMADDDGGGGGSGTGDDANSGDGGAGTGDLGWRSGLPEDIRELETLSKFTEGEGEGQLVPMPISIARSYVNADKLIGRDKIPMPRTKEEWDDAYSRLGRPDTADEYELVADVPADVKELVDQGLDWFKEEALAQGLSKKQAAALYAKYSEVVAEGYKNQGIMAEQAEIDAEKELRQIYGSGYDGKMTLSDRAIHELGGDQAADILKKSGVLNNVVIRRAFIKAGEMMAEDLGLDRDTGGTTMSRQTLEQEKADLMASEAYRDKTNPAHEATVKKVSQIMIQLHGNAPVGPISIPR